MQTRTEPTGSPRSAGRHGMAASVPVAAAARAARMETHGSTGSSMAAGSPTPAGGAHGPVSASRLSTSHSISAADSAERAGVGGGGEERSRSLTKSALRPCHSLRVRPRPSSERIVVTATTRLSRLSMVSSITRFAFLCLTTALWWFTFFCSAAAAPRAGASCSHCARHVSVSSSKPLSTATAATARRRSVSTLRSRKDASRACCFSQRARAVARCRLPSSISRSSSCSLARSFSRSAWEAC
mmetsp:Transcript_6502/g.15376  ORF Transcript_6502/g.15376 Transcript_6502/m.15376 type:complete len:242 (-) Transcript_6502:431-1156(-)